jgi:hypothetical protein
MSNPYLSWMEKIVGGAELELAYPNDGSIAEIELESKAIEAFVILDRLEPDACG